MIKSNLLTFIILLSIPALSSAQDQAYLVNWEQDTIYGKIRKTKEANYYSAIAFDTGSGYERYLPNNVTAYYRPGTGIFHRQDYLNRPVFMKLLQDGAYLKLYEYIFYSDNIGSEISEYFLVKDETEPVMVKSAKFRQQLQEMLQDCPTVSSMANLKNYKLKTLPSLVEEYNHCRKEKNTLPQQQLEAIKAFRNFLQQADDFENQELVLELLGDLEQKIKNQQPVSVYIKKSLINFTEKHPSLAQPAQALIALIEK